MTIQHRSQATISLARLERNIRNMQSRLDPGVEMIAVVKADSYGHGAAGLYPTFRACGVERFAVALWEEGAELRRAGATDCSILILGDTRDEDLQQLLTYRLTPPFSRWKRRKSSTRWPLPPVSFTPSTSSWTRA